MSGRVTILSPKDLPSAGRRRASPGTPIVITAGGHALGGLIAYRRLLKEIVRVSSPAGSLPRPRASQHSRPYAGRAERTVR
jgi:hypothetical protein